MKITVKSNEKKLILRGLGSQDVSKLVEISDDFYNLNDLMNGHDADNKNNLNKLNEEFEVLVKQLTNTKTSEITNLSEKELLSSLAKISDGLHNLNCAIYNYFLMRNEEVPNALIRNVEALIDKFDYIYTEGMVNPLCKRAIIDNFTYEEFEEKFDELCKECDITNSQSLIECALDMFYEQSKYYKAM